MVSRFADNRTEGTEGWHSVFRQGTDPVPALQAEQSG